MNSIFHVEMQKKCVKMQIFTLRQVSKYFFLINKCIIDIIYDTLFILQNTDVNIPPSGDVK